MDKQNKADKNKPKGQDTPKSLGDVNPKTVVNNPAMEYSGRSTDLRNIRDTGNSQGGAVADSRDGLNGNYNINDVDKDLNRAGNVRNQTDNEQTAGDQYDQNAGRPQGKFGGKEGKTMVKNIGLHENHPDLDDSAIQGQQQGGNHGGGAAEDKRFGNQAVKNSARTQQRDQDGDFQGRKGKK